MSPKNNTSEKRPSATRSKAPATKKAASSQPKGRKAVASKGALAKYSAAKAGGLAVAKTSANKTTAKKLPLKKSSAKRVTAKQANVKKAVAKEPTAKKPTAKKPTAKKTAAKKTVAKKPAAKKTTAKKPVAKKAVTAKVAAKKISASKPTAQQATKQHRPASASGTITTASRPLKKTNFSPGGDYAKFRELLLTFRHRLVGDVSMMSQEALGGSDGAADNHAPIHPAEVGTHSFEQEFTLNLLSTDGERLDRIDAALEKIGDGTYGACDECGGRIPRARLEIIPDTPYCVKCASRLEV